MKYEYEKEGMLLAGEARGRNFGQATQFLGSYLEDRDNRIREEKDKEIAALKQALVDSNNARAALGASIKNVMDFTNASEFVDMRYPLLREKTLLEKVMEIHSWWDQALTEKGKLQDKVQALEKVNRERLKIFDFLGEKHEELQSYDSALTRVQILEAWYRGAIERENLLKDAFGKAHTDNQRAKSRLFDVKIHDDSVEEGVRKLIKLYEDRKEAQEFKQALSGNEQAIIHSVVKETGVRVEGLCTFIDEVRALAKAFKTQETELISQRSSAREAVDILHTYAPHKNTLVERAQSLVDDHRQLNETLRKKVEELKQVQNERDRLTETSLKKANMLADIRRRLLDIGFTKEVSVLDQLNNLIEDYMEKRKEALARGNLLLWIDNSLQTVGFQGPTTAYSVGDLVKAYQELKVGGNKHSNVPVTPEIRIQKSIISGIPDPEDVRALAQVVRMQGDLIQRLYSLLDNK